MNLNPGGFRDLTRFASFRDVDIPNGRLDAVVPHLREFFHAFGGNFTDDRRFMKLRFIRFSRVGRASRIREIHSESGAGAKRGGLHKIAASPVILHLYSFQKNAPKRKQAAQTLLI